MAKDIKGSWERTSPFNMNGTGDFQGFRITKRGAGNNFLLYKVNREIKFFNNVDNWDYMEAVASKYVARILEGKESDSGDDAILTDPDAKWRTNPPTESQLAYATKLLKGKTEEASLKKLSRGELSELIDKLINK